MEGGRKRAREGERGLNVTLGLVLKKSMERGDDLGLWLQNHAFYSLNC